jgi:lipopolysaccharide/colanic/teichoic acid biosynthesis glycosyltransferase
VGLHEPLVSDDVRVNESSHKLKQPILIQGWTRKKEISLVAYVFKRVIDVAGATFFLLLTSPLIAVTAVIIKLTSHGPIFYQSKRVGLGGCKFDCLKFRTMLADADELKESLAHLNERDDVFFKISEDPRITQVGRLIRKYSLDEIPQMVNVLRGEMSLVGPRPPLPEEVECYTAEQFQRLSVLPGITGLWQVSARQNPSFEVCVNYDLQYISSWTPLLDLKILLQTVPAVLKGTGR